MDRMLFDARVISRRRAIYPMYRPNKGGLAVDAGTIHGVSEDTTFAVYRNRDYKPDDAPVATVMAAKVYAFTTELKCLGPLTRDGQLALSATPSCFAVPNSMSKEGALRLHITGPTDSNHRCILDALEEVVQTHQASGSPVIFMVDDPSQANLSVCAAGGDITYTIHDRSITDRGVSQLWRTTVAESSAVQPVLSAAAKFFWHLHHAPTRKDDLKGRIEIQVFELEPDFNADLGADLRRPYIAHGDDLARSGVVDVIADDDTPYGIRVRNNFLAPLHVWAFYFNCSTLAIRKSHSKYCSFGGYILRHCLVDEYYRPPAIAENAAAPLPPAKCDHKKCAHTENVIAKDDMKGELTIGYGAGGGQPYTFFIPDDDQDLEVGFIKLFISTEPVDLSSIAQRSPWDTAVARNPNKDIRARPVHGVWDTFALAVVQRRP